MASKGALALAITICLPLAAEDERRKGTIPYDELKEGFEEKVRHVIEHKSLKRALKEVEFVGTDAVYSFLLGRMPFAADAIRVLRLQDYRVKDNGDGSFTADDGAGVSGVFHLVYEEKGKKIYYAIGRYDGELLKVKGKAVAIVEFEEASGNTMRNWVFLWFRFDSIILGTVAKALSPIVGPLVDKKINYFLNAARSLSRRIVEEPQQTYERLRKSDEMDAAQLEAFRRAFVGEADGKAAP